MFARYCLQLSFPVLIQICRYSIDLRVALHSLSVWYSPFSACMSSRRSRRVAVSSVRSSASGFSAEERKMIPQLLELLRSGALASLMPVAQPETKRVTSAVEAPETPALQKPAISPVSHVSSRNAKA